jgi:Cu(I)/Ag(I) efflux system membrane fusion protein
MPLIPADSGDATGDSGTLRLSEAARALARVETVPVARRKLSKEIRAVGKVQFNESTLATVTIRVDGYVERLFADYTGMTVEKGDHLVEVYSPDLVIAQRELLLALNEPVNPARLEETKRKLRRWEVSDAQVEELVRTRTIQERLTVHSTVRGTIVEKNVVEKSPVKAGDILYRVADLRSVWVYLNIYEFEIGWVQYGQRVSLEAEAYPGERFPGMVTFVSPTLDEETRSIRVRVNVENPDGRLKPGMFVSARIEVGLRADGRAAPTGVEGKFACPMHPEVLADAPGPCKLCGMELRKLPDLPAPPPPPKPRDPYACPMHPEVTAKTAAACTICGMDLERIPDPGPGAATDDPLAVPISAVLDSGTRRIVYVERTTGDLAPVDVILGPRADGYYAVLSGLKEGDRVVARGGFLLDSQFQIRGLPSLLAPHGATTQPGHEH